MDGYGQGETDGYGYFYGAFNLMTDEYGDVDYKKVDDVLNKKLAEIKIKYSKEQTAAIKEANNKLLLDFCKQIKPGYNRERIALRDIVPECKVLFDKNYEKKLAEAAAAAEGAEAEADGEDATDVQEGGYAFVHEGGASRSSSRSSKGSKGSRRSKGSRSSKGSKASKSSKGSKTSKKVNPPKVVVKKEDTISPDDYYALGYLVGYKDGYSKQYDIGFVSGRTLAYDEYKAEVGEPAATGPTAPSAATAPTASKAA